MLNQPRGVYCITQDPPGERAWSRINDEVTRHEQHIKNFLAWLSGQGFSQQQQNAIEVELRKDVGTLGGATARQHRDFIEIEPSTVLGDTLDFDPERIKQTIVHGYKDALGVFKDRG